MRIDAQEMTKGTLSAVDFQLYRQKGEDWEAILDRSIPVADIPDWPIEIVVRPDGDPARVFEVRARAVDEAANTGAWTRAVSTYVEDQVSVLPLLLEDNCVNDDCDTPDDCFGEACLVCRAGACGAVEIAVLVPYDGSRAVIDDITLAFPDNGGGDSAPDNNDLVLSGDGFSRTGPPNGSVNTPLQLTNDGFEQTVGCSDTTCLRGGFGR